MFVSAGGTVVASNSAVPGDFLFPIDRAVENVHLAFSGKGGAELRVRLAEERLDEVEKLIARARLEAKARVTASSSATTTPNKDKKTNVAVGVNTAIGFLNTIALDLSESGNATTSAQIRQVISRLEGMVNDPDVRVKLKENGDFQLRLKNASSSATSTGSVKIDTSGNKNRIEVREDGDKFRIEIKDNGDVKIKTQVESEVEVKGDDDDRNDDRDDEKDDDDDDDDDDKDNKGRDNGINASSTLRLELR